jgi:hypothetical protein
VVAVVTRAIWRSIVEPLTVSVFEAHGISVPHHYGMWMTGTPKLLRPTARPHCAINGCQLDWESA